MRGRRGSGRRRRRRDRGEEEEEGRGRRRLSLPSTWLVPLWTPVRRGGGCDVGGTARKKATDEIVRDANQEEAGRPRKSDGSGCGEDRETHLGHARLPGGHQIGPQVRVQQHTAESKERIAECIDEEIIDAPVPHQSQEILGASLELFQTTIDDLVQEKAVKETAEEGGGAHGRSRSTSSATALWNIMENLCRTVLFERRSSLTRSCSTQDDTGDVNDKERHSQRASRLLMFGVLCRTTWKRCNVEEEVLYPPHSKVFHVGKTGWKARGTGPKPCFSQVH